MLQAAQRVGDFEIIRPLGRGGMGEVYEAQQFNPSRRVALKVLSPWLAQDEASLERFRREVEVLANLDHPGIVHVITTGRTDDGIAYYAMKLIRGVSLSDMIRISAEGQALDATAPTVSLADRLKETPGGDRTAAFVAPTPAETAPAAAIEEYRTNRFQFVARIGVAAARALAAAHQQGHLHRDIKPSNLMIDHHGQLYLVDFGLTRALDPGANVSRTGGIRGTPWYMSPEQARGDPVDQRTDIYSLGITLYELATVGTGPFTASRDDPESVLAQVRTGLHLPLRALAPQIPWELEQVILRAIQLKQRRRYQRADELAEDLERLIPSGSGLLTPSKHYSSARGHRARIPIVVGCAAIALAIAFLLWLRPFLRPDRETAATSRAPANGQNEMSVGAADGPPSEVPSRAAESSGTPNVQADATTDAYPAMLRNPPTMTPVPLLRGDNLPIWRDHRLLGQGSYNGLPSELVVTSLVGDRPTVVALADSRLAEPGRPWFEFSIEVRQSGVTAAGDNVNRQQSEVGVFWGCREAPGESTGRSQFFVARLDERPRADDIHAQLTIGWSLIESSDGSRGGLYTWLRSLPKGKGIVRNVNAVSKPGAWHEVRVRAQNHQIRITLGDGAFQEFETAWLTQVDPWLKDAGLDPRGSMGVWVSDGVGSFRNATYTALP
jgi:serine/threonine protein kinase